MIWSVDNFSKVANFSPLTSHFLLLQSPCQLPPRYQKLFPDILYNFRGGFDIFDVVTYLAYFEFAIVDISFKHAFFSPAFTEDCSKGFGAGAGFFFGSDLIKEFIMQHTHRG